MKPGLRLSYISAFCGELVGSLPLCPVHSHTLGIPKVGEPGAGLPSLT